MAESILRIARIGYGSAPLEADAILHHVHPTNYRFLVHDPHGEYGGHVVYYDHDGLTADPNGGQTAGMSRFRVAVLGDSFVEAGQVAFSDSFVGRLQARGRADTIVRNYGVASYSPIIYRLLWDHKVSSFGPTHVFVLLYSNDFADDKRYVERALFSSFGDVRAVRGAGSMAWTKIPGGGLVIRQLRRSYLARLIRKLSQVTQLKLTWSIRNGDNPKPVVGNLVEEAPELSEPTTGYVLSLASAVEQVGADFVLMVVPSKFQLQREPAENETSSEVEYSDRWASWARRHSIKFIDFVEPFEAEYRAGRRPFFVIDSHFNELGHAVVARVIAQHFPTLFSERVLETRDFGTQRSEN